MRRSMDSAWVCTPLTRVAVYSRTGGAASAERSARVCRGSVPRSSDSNRMSSARLRALVRVEDGRGPAGAAPDSDTTQVVACPGVDLDLLPGGQEQRDLDVQPGLHGGGLGAAGAPVAL